MQLPITIVAEMADGVIVEHVGDINDFLDAVLSFRADSECRRLSWHETPAHLLTLVTLPASSYVPAGWRPGGDDAIDPRRRALPADFEMPSFGMDPETGNVER